MKPRTDFPLEPGLDVEVLAEVLGETMHAAATSRFKQHLRRYAGVLLDALQRRDVLLSVRPPVVELHQRPRFGAGRRSTAPVRNAAMNAYATTRATRGEVDAVAAALRATMACEPTWSVAEAVEHTLRFVLKPRREAR